MYVWKVKFAVRHTVGSEKWDESTESGYAAEVDGVLFETVADAAGGKKFESREDAEAWRDQWLREFDANGGTVGVEGGEYHDVKVSSSWELTEL